MSTVLIAYGTRFGCTEEVSQKIATMLKEKGIDTTLVNLVKTKKKEWPHPDAFDGVLVGSSIKINRWTKEPLTFLKNHQKVLTEKPLGIFVCCISAVTDPDYAKKTYLEGVMEKVGVKAHVYDAFGGVLDFTESSHLGFMDKKMLQTAAKEMQKEKCITIDENARNDFRDWDQIRGFAEQFAAVLG